ncbi:MAG: FecR domain-containing protein [Armatimonadota bacterium]|nr:FecR domain-containing protein [Armatimonadota bacterium]MCX7778154.1 FecR domain-containing protein [Armatimonadota bacterium]MDW8024508.1 FecR domain-containing protein [Armatimonadota bacterium]
METLVCKSCGAHNAVRASICWRCYAPLKGAAVQPSSTVIAQPLVVVFRTSLTRYLAEVPPYQWFALLAFVLLLGMVAILRPSGEALSLLIIRASLLILGAVAVDTVLGQGGIDLSIGATAMLSGTVALFLLPIDVSAAVAGGFVAGVLMGLINAVAVGIVPMPKAITTLTTGALALYLAISTRGKLPQTWEDSLFAFLCRGSIYGIPLPALVVALVVLAFYFVWLRELTRVAPRRHRQVAVSVERVWVEPVYIFSGLIAGIVGVLGAAGSNVTAQPLAPDWTWILAPLVGALIGGTTLSGDIGGIGSALLGGALLAVILYLCEELRLPLSGLPIVALLLFVSVFMDDLKRATLEDLKGAWKRFLVRLWGEELDRTKMARTLFYMFLACCAIVFACYATFSYYAVNRVPPHFAMALQPVGNVELQIDDKAPWQPVVHRQLLSEGTKLRLGEGARLLLRFSDGSTVDVRGRSEFALLSIDDMSTGIPNTRFEFRSGDLWGWIKRYLERPTDYSIETPAAVLGVRGTKFRAFVKGGEANVAVVDGAVTALLPRGAETITSGEEALVSRITKAIRKMRIAENILASLRAEFATLHKLILTELRRAWRNNLLERGWIVLCIVLIAFSIFSAYIFHLERLEEQRKALWDRQSQMLGLVHLYVQQRQFDDARKLLHKIVEEDPHSEWGIRAQRMLEEWDSQLREIEREEGESKPQGGEQ